MNEEQKHLIISRSCCLDRCSVDVCKIANLRSVVKGK
uniref:Uncharacterized protein n=1 Tax=Anguilla anguilla TaxID=7936 RepID=A0A0E9W5Q6_ANGAN